MLEDKISRKEYLNHWSSQASFGSSFSNLEFPRQSQRENHALNQMELAGFSPAQVNRLFLIRWLVREKNIIGGAPRDFTLQPETTDPLPNLAQLDLFWAVRNFKLKEGEPSRKRYWQDFCDSWDKFKNITPDWDELTTGMKGYENPVVFRDWDERIREQLISYRNWVDLTDRKQLAEDKEVEFPTLDEDRIETAIDKFDKDPCLESEDYDPETDELRAILQLIQLGNIKEEPFSRLYLSRDQESRLVALRRFLGTRLAPFTDFGDGMPTDPNQQPFTQNYPHANSDSNKRDLPTQTDRDKENTEVVWEQVNQAVYQSMEFPNPSKYLSQEEQTRLKSLKRGSRRKKFPLQDPRSSDEIWLEMNKLRGPNFEKPTLFRDLKPLPKVEPYIPTFSSIQDQKFRKLVDRVDNGGRSVEDSVEDDDYKLLPENQFSRVINQTILNILGLATRPTKEQFEALEAEIDQTPTTDTTIRLTDVEEKDLNKARENNNPLIASAFPSSWNQEEKGQPLGKPTIQQAKRMLQYRHKLEQHGCMYFLS